jgi:hypothetical protein
LHRVAGLPLSDILHLPCTVLLRDAACAGSADVPRLVTHLRICPLPPASPAFALSRVLLSTHIRLQALLPSASVPLSESLAAARPHPFVQRAIRAWPTFRWACAQPAHRPLTTLSDSPAACADAWAVAVGTLIAVLTPSDLADALEPSAGLDVATRCAAVAAPPPLQSAMAVAAVDVPHGQFSREAAARSASGSGAAMVAAEPFEGICLPDELPPAEAMRRAEAHAESAADESTAAQCRLDVLQRSAPLEGTSGNAVCGAVVEAGFGSVLVGWETGIGLTVQPSAPLALRSGVSPACAAGVSATRCPSGIASKSCSNKSRPFAPSSLRQIPASASRHPPSHGNPHSGGFMYHSVCYR